MVSPFSLKTGFRVIQNAVDTEFLVLIAGSVIMGNFDGGLELVSCGANDSGGAGFKYLRIPLVENIKVQTGMN